MTDEQVTAMRQIVERVASSGTMAICTCGWYPIGQGAVATVLPQPIRFEDVNHRPDCLFAQARAVLAQLPPA